MKLTTESARAQVVRSVTVEDGPVLSMTYSTTGKKYRVDRISITYRWVDGEWKVSSPWSVDLIGVVLKKDGSESANTTKRNADYANRVSGTDWAPEYDFLKPIIELLRPSTDMTMITVTDYEV